MTSEVPSRSIEGTAVPHATGQAAASPPPASPAPRAAASRTRRARGAPYQEPSATLRIHATSLQRALAKPVRRPARWASPAFAREVDLVRSHLRPIRSLDMLAASYGRESFQAGNAAEEGGASTILARSATEVAYALRWLEISGAASEAPWVVLIRSGS